MSESTPPPAEGQPATGEADGQPKPTETVDYWKARSRENEARAKENAAKARDYDAYVESQKTEQQRAADALASAQRDLESARSEALRFRIAAKHKLSEDDLDLLGSGTEEQLEARATRIAALSAGASSPPPPPGPKPDPHQGAPAGKANGAAAGLAEAAKRFGTPAGTQTT